MTLKNRSLNPLDQDRTFCFCLVTPFAICPYFFGWDTPNEVMWMEILNTICGWPFDLKWNEVEDRHSHGKVITMTDEIRKGIQKLRNGFMHASVNEHKQLISDFCNKLSQLKNGNLFYIYRIVYSEPSRTLLFKVQNKLQYICNGKSKEEADDWFSKNAESFFNEYMTFQFIHGKIGEPERTKRVCRFCKRSVPDTTFDELAHIIPESLGGTRNLACLEECDDCNGKFGKGVEQNLCNWFEIRRSTGGITKKSGGIPKAYGRNYVFENNQLSVYPDKLDQEVKLVGAKTVTLQGIYRALCKLAIDVIDSKYLDRLETTIEWIRFGKPKSSKYPMIAQMFGLLVPKEPQITLFIREDGMDSDNAPLCFCIFRVFNMALLYILPHVDGKMTYPDDYHKTIPAEALKLLGYKGDWIWEHYDTTEERDPHVMAKIQLQKVKPAPVRKDKGPIDKLQKEKKTKDAIYFPKPKRIDHPNCSVSFNPPKWKATDNTNYITGHIKVKIAIDVKLKRPMILQLVISYLDQRNRTSLATINSCSITDSKLLINQIDYDSKGTAFNQDLVVEVLEFHIAELFSGIKKQYPEFPYTRKMLEINNVRELLAETQLQFTRNGTVISDNIGSDLWHSGY